MQTGLAEQLGPYQKRIPIVTRSIKGRFRNFKTAVLVFAYASFFLLQTRFCKQQWHERC